MSARQRSVYRLLSRVLPAAFRRRAGGDLEDAAMACVGRERGRLGRLGVLVAWGGILIDLVISAVALRWPVRSPAQDYGAPSDAMRSQPATLAAIVHDILQEIRMPRLIRGHRGYALLAVTSLSLAVGATLAVFTVVNALWLKPLPFLEPDRVVMVVDSTSGQNDYSYSEPMADRFGIFEAVAGQVVTSADRAGQAAQLSFDAAGRELEILGVTAKYFNVLGQSIRGRDFTSDDNRPGTEPVAIISDRLWTGAFNRRDDVIGTLAPATPFPVRIVGVAPRGFEGARRGERTDVWVPPALAARLSPTAATTDAEGGSTLLLARLKPGQTPAVARQQFVDQVLGLFMKNREPGPSFDGIRQSIEAMRVVRLANVFGSPNSRTIVISEGRTGAVVAGLAALVLLGSCATLMALVLVHYERRRRELSVRLALGASRLRLAAQLGTEFGWLAAAGTAGAIVIALAGLRVLPALSLPGGVDLGRLDLSLDWRVLGVAIGTTTLTLAMAALVPLLRFTRGDLAGEVVAVRATTPTSSQRLRQVLLALHVSATIVVLVSAGLFVRAVVYGFTAGPGFDSDRTVSVRMLLAPIRPSPGRDVPTQLAAVFEKTERIVDGLRALPGVDDVSRGGLPIGLERMYEATAVKTVQAGSGERQLTIGTLQGSPRLSGLLGVQVLKGRELTSADAPVRGGTARVLVTASLARTLWAANDPIGQVITIAGRARYEVVGVIADFVYGSMSQPAAGTVVSVSEPSGISQSFVVHATRPETVVEPIRRVVTSIFPDAQWINIATGRETIARDLGRQRLGAWFFSGFGLIALVLGAGGVFGLVAYLAESRRREFGVRMALGASPGELVRRGMAAGLVPVGVGAVAGLVVAAIVSRLFVAALPGLSTLDPLTYAGVALLMTTCAASAALTAAWRLRTSSPADALRAE